MPVGFFFFKKSPSPESRVPKTGSDPPIGSDRDSGCDKATMADERINQTVEQETVAERLQRHDTMEDFWRPIIQAEYLAVRQPAMEANNFELKPTLITMVHQHQFTGHPTEDPNEHLGRFLRMANTVKLNGVRPKVIKLQLFPFSLRDIAAT